MLFQSELKTKIPTINVDSTQDIDACVRQTDAEANEKAKTNTDERRHASPRDMKVGDLVLVTERKRNKYSTRFCKDPVTISEIRETQLILTDIHGKQQKGNSSHVRNFGRNLPTHFQ